MSQEFTKRYTIDHLISKRAINRQFIHFNSDNSKCPEGFLPHPSPLGLAYGRPNPQYYPIKKITIALDEYPFQDSLFSIKKHDEVSFDVLRVADEAGSIGLNEAFQYGDLNGLPAFEETKKSENRELCELFGQPIPEKYIPLRINPFSHI